MLHNAKRIVIKIGSSLLVDEAQGHVRMTLLHGMAEDITALRRNGKSVVVVTSGSVGLGRVRLGMKKGVLSLEEKQAAAACGQPLLMAKWQEVFAEHGLESAQVLLTADDSIDRRRYLNARSTLETLLEWQVVPIINENDTVATAELKIGDNDRLSARVAEMVSADCLVLFSDIDGLYERDPRTHPGTAFIERVEAITPQIEACAGGVGSGVGTGGMVTKLQAAKIALAAGCHMAIALGSAPHALRTLAEGGRATWFIASETPVSARKRWIGGSLHAAGTMVVDDGAAQALRAGKSLLPAGVTKIEGQFSRGDAVLIKDEKGRILGKGLSAYASADAVRIQGRQSADIEQLLGFKGRTALIHRDDLVLE